jgi:Activator of Hsp90 ATPase homolog 1-like protein
MTTLQFSIPVNASKEKVWESLWQDANYREWTSAFCEGSYAESEWKQGSKIKFLTPDGTGMFSVIETLIPQRQMTFVHHGEIKDGKEETKDWSGAKESYLLEEATDSVVVKVTVDTNEKMQDYFKGVFPKALDKLKQIAER